MASTDVELEKQIKAAGKKLFPPPHSVDELLPVLDQVEKLLSKVDQSPKKSMIDALRPSMKALIHFSLSKHPNVDVKVAVASCISEITRITAPDAPYNDKQMRDVFQLIVSSFEDLADQSSRSYSKRVSILETVSKVRSCVIMLDLECEDLIVKMFEHFLNSVRDYHLDSIFSSMETIMVLVLEESEENAVEILKPILASVKKNQEGILPVARKLGEGVLLKAADNIQPYVNQALKSLGESLDMYTKVVTSVCEGTTATFENNDENTFGLQSANESKLEKGSVEETQQTDESKLSDHRDQVTKEEACPQEEVDLTMDRSPKSVMSNGVNETVNEEASVDQESKKPEEDKSQQPFFKDTDDSDTDKLAKSKSQTEPSDSSHVEGEKENDVKESENEKDDDGVKESEIEIEIENNVNESENEAVVPSKTEKDSDVQVSSPKATESKPPATANVSSPSQSNSLSDQRPIRSKKKRFLQDDETASPSNGGSTPDETPVKNVSRAKSKGLTREDTPKEQKVAGKKTVIEKEIKLPDTVNESVDGEAASDSDAKPQKKSKSETVSEKEIKLPNTVDESEDGEATTDSEAKPAKESKSKSKPKSTKQSGKKPKQSGKKIDVGESDAKKSKQAGNNMHAKEEDNDSDAKPRKTSKKGEKSKITVEEEDESDSDNKLLKQSAKKSSAKKKDTGKKRGNGKNVPEKGQAKSQSGDDEMDSPASSAKRKRNTGKDTVTPKYDESLVGKKVKVWWPEDKMFYEGVVEEFYPANKKHKISYLDGDEETLNLKTQRWEILQKFSSRDNKEQTIDAQNEEASPGTHMKKKSKKDPAASVSQEKVKDSAKKVGVASSSGKSKKENSAAKSPASKEAGKLKEDEETPKAGTKTKAVNKSKGKTPPSGSKAKTGSSNVKESDVKTSESGKGKSMETPKGGSKSGKKRKKRS